PAGYRRRPMNDLMELMGRSPAIQTVRADIRKLVGAGSAHRPPAILIQGETGTGKGLVAKLLHGLGPRRDGVFVEVNCAAIPDTLLEAEFFGYERGAFTDARRSKPGLFQTAHRGTIFLDEIGLLPEILQAKLLKVVEERSVRRLGAIYSENVDVWIISATNTDVVRAIRTGKFRADLYHRLAVLTLALPPLRERGDDALLLAEHFLARASSDYGLPTRTRSADARSQVLAYRWPGNVRELANAMERAALLAQTSARTAPTGGPATAPTPAGRSARALPLDTAVQQHVEAALDETSWNISRTAAILGISRNTLRSHIRKFGLRAPVVAPRAPADPLPPSGVDTGQAVVGSGEAPTASREGALRWERRRIAALATSLEASTDLAAFQLASTQYDLIEKLRSFGARVEELTPISMVALFVPQPMEDAARRAARRVAAFGPRPVGEAASRPAPPPPAIRRAPERGGPARLPAVNARFAIH